MSRNRVARIEGLTVEEVLSIPQDELELYIGGQNALVLKVGTAEILCQFEFRISAIDVILAHIDGGGEGVLRTLHHLVTRFAKARQVQTVNWTVTAVACASPNLKLRHLLERMNFRVLPTPQGPAYFKSETVPPRGDVASNIPKIEP